MYLMPFLYSFANKTEKQNETGYVPDSGSDLHEINVKGLDYLNYEL